MSDSKPVSGWVDMKESLPELNELVIGWHWQESEAVCVAYMMNNEFVGVGVVSENDTDNDLQIYHYTAGTISHFQKMPTTPFTADQDSLLVTH